MITLISVILSGCTQSDYSKMSNQEKIEISIEKLSEGKINEVMEILAEEVETYLENKYGSYTKLYNVKPDMDEEMRIMYNIYCYVKAIDFENNKSYDYALHSLSSVEPIDEVVTKKSIEEYKEKLEELHKIDFDSREKKLKEEQEKKAAEESRKEVALREREKLLESSPPWIGMTAEEVRKSAWGPPEDINRTTTAYGTSEQWVYSDYRYVYLEDGVVTAIQD